MVKKKLTDLFAAYKGSVGATQPEAAASLTLAHVIDDLREDLQAALNTATSEGEVKAIADVLDEIRGQGVQI